jgi:hypothetical protein
MSSEKKTTQIAQEQGYELRPAKEAGAKSQRLKVRLLRQDELGGVVRGSAPNERRHLSSMLQTPDM